MSRPIPNDRHLQVFFREYNQNIVRMIASRIISQKTNTEGSKRPNSSFASL